MTKRQTRAELAAELAEAREQQAAASEILRVISSSPTGVQPTFESDLGGGSTFTFTLPLT